MSQVKGKVTAVDPRAKSFVVHSDSGADITLRVDDRTQFSPEGNRWDDIKEGASVTGTYHTDGTGHVAGSVMSTDTGHGKGGKKPPHTT
jgi:hypothetical protein